MKLFTFSLFSILLLLFSTSAETRKFLKEKNNSNPLPTLPEENAEDQILYSALDRAKDLHRKAIYLFYLGQFKDSETCFSLSYKLWPESPKICLDFAICSLLYPNPYRSFTRAEQLIAERESHKKNDRAILIEALLHYQKLDIPSFQNKIQQIKSKRFQNIGKQILNFFNKGEPILNAELLQKILPLRMSPTEKRNLR